MGVRYIVGELVSGRRFVNLPVVSGTWANALDTHDTVTATVNLGNKVVRGLDLRNAATRVKHYLAAVDLGPFGQNGEILAAGPLWSVDYGRDGMTLELTARGILSIFDHRNVLPLAALTLPEDQWTIADPEDPAGVGRLPNPLVATTFTTYSVGGIIVKLIAQAMSWPGGALPLTLPPAEAGTVEQVYQGSEFKKVGAAITDLVKRQNGVEVKAPARFTPDGLGVVWDLKVGTTAEPLLFSPTKRAWNVTVKDSPIKGLKLGSDGSNLASISWATGGRQNDTVLISRKVDMDLVSRGYPLLETVDSTHSDVTEQATLDDYAEGNLSAASSTVELWSFSVKAHPMDRRRQAAGPQLEDYDVGDFIRLHIDPYDDKTNLGDLFMPGGGDIDLRITNLSGDQDGEDVAIKCAPVFA
jgi:hypothetical protein